MRNYLIYIVLLFFSCSLFAAVGKSKILYTQIAESGQIKILDKAAKTYRLTLYKTHPMTTYFSDRPQRIAGEIPTSKFIENWNKGTNNFKQDPPNAILVYLDKNYHIHKQVVELYLLQYNKNRQLLSYQARSLNHDTLTATTILEPVLFIDDKLPLRFCIADQCL